MCGARARGMVPARGPQAGMRDVRERCAPQAKGYVSAAVGVHEGACVHIRVLSDAVSAYGDVSIRGSACRDARARKGLTRARMFMHKRRAYPGMGMHGSLHVCARMGRDRCGVRSARWACQTRSCAKARGRFQSA
jgi:hypothetical protein